VNSDEVIVSVLEKVVATSKIKKTGQTTTYTAFDDGYYQKGVTPSYSRANDMVTDTITGLIWQDNEEAKTIRKNWEDAKSYCSSLSLGDTNDWRLPTIVELQSIVVDGKASPSIDTEVFVNYTTSNYYWSSTTYASLTNGAWSVYLYKGRTYYYDKSYSYYVRCVRAGQ
jgi:formylglycine-generating enzyme required for sulfatase activity